MALRVCSAIRCKSWTLLSLLFLLLFLALSALMISTLPFPLPVTIQRLASRGLSVAGGPTPGGMYRDHPTMAPLHLLTPNIHSGAWRQADGKESSKHLLMVVDKAGVRGSPGDVIHDTSHTHLRGRTTTRRIKGIASKRKETPASKHQTRKHPLPLVNDVPGRVDMLANHSSASQLSSNPRPAPRHDGPTDQAAAADLETSEPKQTPDRHKYAKHAGKAGKAFEEHKDVQKTARALRKRKAPSSKKNKRSNGGLKPQAALEQRDGVLCKTGTEAGLFPDQDQRRIRTDTHPLPWLSTDDLQKMEMLSGGDVVSKARVPAHGQVLQVALGPGTQPGGEESHSGRCEQGHCALVKRAEDWFEVFGFHLDRVLGLNRTLPTVLRSFHSDILPYRFHSADRTDLNLDRYTSGTPRPVVWWDPEIQHLADKDNDQNSIPLTWTQYQHLLLAGCGRGVGLNSAPCVGVNHSEWGRLALFDFLLQVNDRLDRYCCGFIPGPGEPCVENLLHVKCNNPKDLVLVHILVRKTDRTKLVFIDNAGRPHHPSDNLNFRLVEGINEFPERAVSVLQSGCLEAMLLHSLYTDKEFWNSQGGESGVRPLIRTVEQRSRILLQHIHDKKLRLNRDL
ncbi:Golgi-associated kinase 1A isoform X1 [Hypomesus transpacificus]|uniref:Golgi-associated kinase 1A isoform X1 n=1 Tax=Hypomesus transpacificus TaxID=137520 RepID=UPI001F07834F|nr:Golgi-associated kinase 1A isoform X1 [Hypomesus transpacificus]XP_046898396.1 Golgi-associated kinase 1A isoform X1 [Hypomesus transpacificus]